MAQALFVLSSAAAATAQCSLSLEAFGRSGTDGDVASAAAWDPDGPGPAQPVIVCAGQFRQVGTVVSESVAAFDPAAASWSEIGAAGLPGAGSVSGATVHSVFVRANGDLLAAAGGVFRWDGAAWQLEVPGSFGVRAIAEDVNGDLLLAGQFQSVAGVPADNVARWDGAAASAVGPVAAPGTFTDAVWDIAVRPNGDIVVAGPFTDVFGGPNHLAVFDGTTWTSLSSFVNPLQMAWAVETLPNGDVAVAVQRGGWQRVEQWDGATFTLLGTADDIVRDLHVDALGSLTAVGDFTAIDALGSVPGVARFDGVTWLASYYSAPFDPGAAEPWMLSYDDGRRLGLSTGPVTAAVPGGTSVGYVDALTRSSSGDLVVGGSFGAAGHVAVHNLAAFRDGAWRSLGGGVDGVVRDVLELPSGDLIVAGRFSSAGGLSNCVNIARWDGVAWSRLGSGLGGGFQEVRALEVLPSGDLVAGGTFTFSGSSAFPVSRLARWDGAAWSALGGGVTSSDPNVFVDDLELLPGGELLVVGAFDEIGGVSAHHVALWDGVSFASTSAGPAVGATAAAPLPDGSVAVSFLMPSGSGEVRRWTGAAWATMGGVLPFRVRSLGAMATGALYAGSEAGELLRWDGGGWTALAASAQGGEVRALAADGPGGLLVGGQFAEFDGRVCGGMAQLAPVCPSSVSVFGGGCLGAAGALVPLTPPVLGTTFEVRADGLPSPSIVLAMWSLGNFGQGLPLSAFFAEAPAGCFAYVLPDATQVFVGLGQPIETAVALPPLFAAAGWPLHQQLVPFLLDAQGELSSVTATDAIVATLGW